METASFGGTGITRDKLIGLVGSWNVDGTQYQLDNWLDEVDLFRRLVPGVSKVWIPYGGAECYGMLERIEWDKVKIKNYSFATEETKDWWFYTPTLIVKDDEGAEWYVYEYSFYEQNAPIPIGGIKNDIDRDGTAVKAPAQE